MAISRKNSRPIKVDDIEYRWVFFENSGWNDITIQSVTGNGQKLIIQQEWTGPYHNEGFSVTPSMVRAMIDGGLRLGWTPDKPGPELRLRWDKIESLNN